MDRNFYTEAKLCFAYTREITTKKNSSINIKSDKKVEISLEFVKIRLHLGFNQLARGNVSHALTTQPQTLNKHRGEVAIRIHKQKKYNATLKIE